jgi:mono/diheme cytochrome c family protein
MRSLLNALSALLVLAVVAAGQAVDTSKKSPVTPSGQQLFAAHCATCHGVDAKGGGPMSPQLKVWPPDLTVLAKNNHGSFPALHVGETISGEFQKPSHGPREMPIWGPVFRSDAQGRGDSAQLRIDNLVKYIESLQEK